MYSVNFPLVAVVLLVALEATAQQVLGPVVAGDVVAVVNLIGVALADLREVELAERAFLQLAKTDFLPLVPVAPLFGGESGLVTLRLVQVQLLH